MFIGNNCREFSDEMSFVAGVAALAALLAQSLCYKIKAGGNNHYLVKKITKQTITIRKLISVIISIF